MGLQLGTVVTTSGKPKICCLLQKRAWGHTASRRQNLDICLSDSSTRAVNHCSTLTCIQIIFFIKTESVPSRLGKPGLIQNLLCCWAWVTVLQRPSQGEMQTSKTKVTAPASESGGSRPGIPDTGEGPHDASSAQNSPSVKRRGRRLRGPPPSAPRNYSRLRTLRMQPWATVFHSLKHFLFHDNFLSLPDFNFFHFIENSWFTCQQIKRCS